MDLVKNTIDRMRIHQKYVLLEGFCNSSKLIFDDDKLELRYMDEFLKIEKTIG
jgi:hypothetical protein